MSKLNTKEAWSNVEKRVKRLHEVYGMPKISTDNDFSDKLDFKETVIYILESIGQGGAVRTIIVEMTVDMEGEVLFDGYIDKKVRQTDGIYLDGKLASQRLIALVTDNRR